MTIDLATKRTELIELREKMVHAATDLVAGDAGGEINSPAGDQHLADHATDLVDRELDQSLGEHADSVVADIDAALARIDEGTYGLCAKCGAPIPEERLDAIPYAILCLEDKRLQENG